MVIKEHSEIETTLFIIALIIYACIVIFWLIRWIIHKKNYCTCHPDKQNTRLINIGGKKETYCIICAKKVKF